MNRNPQVKTQLKASWAVAASPVNGGGRILVALLLPLPTPADFVKLVELVGDNSEDWISTLVIFETDIPVLDEIGAVFLILEVFVVEVDDEFVPKTVLCEALEIALEVRFSDDIREIAH